MDAVTGAQAEFERNSRENRSYLISLEDGTRLTGKPYRVQPSDPFFVIWLDTGRVACFDFTQLKSFAPLPETRKSNILKGKSEEGGASRRMGIHRV